MSCHNGLIVAFPDDNLDDRRSQEATSGCELAGHNWDYGT